MKAAIREGQFWKFNNNSKDITEAEPDDIVFIKSNEEAKKAGEITEEEKEETVQHLIAQLEVRFPAPDGFTYISEWDKYNLRIEVHSHLRARGKIDPARCKEIARKHKSVRVGYYFSDKHSDLEKEGFVLECGILEYNPAKIRRRKGGRSGALKRKQRNGTLNKTTIVSFTKHMFNIANRGPWSRHIWLNITCYNEREILFAWSLNIYKAVQQASRVGVLRRNKTYRKYIKEFEGYLPALIKSEDKATKAFANFVKRELKEIRRK